MGIQKVAILAIIAERKKQDEKWGEQNHDMATWLEILGEEYGEICKADLEFRFGSKSRDRILEEIIQTTAVGLAMIESWIRNNKKVGDR